MGAGLAKYERSMWKILVGLEKFAKVSESLITFLLNWKKTVKLRFDFTLRTVSCSQISACSQTTSDYSASMCELAFYPMRYI